MPRCPPWMCECMAARARQSDACRASTTLRADSGTSARLGGKRRFARSSLARTAPPFPQATHAVRVRVHTSRARDGASEARVVVHANTRHALCVLCVPNCAHAAPLHQGTIAHGQVWAPSPFHNTAHAAGARLLLPVPFTPVTAVARHNGAPRRRWTHLHATRSSGWSPPADRCHALVTRW